MSSNDASQYLDRKDKNSFKVRYEIEKRFWIGLSDTPELDKSGRVLIAPMLRSGANINKEIVMLGVGENLEIWDAKRLGRHKEIIRAKNE